MKKFVLLIMTVLLCFNALTGCGRNQKSSGAPESESDSRTISQSAEKTQKP